MNKPDPERACAHCVHFQNDAASLERMFPGLNSMSSGFASVRSQDGLCHRHARYLSSQDSCSDFLRTKNAALLDNGATPSFPTCKGGIVPT